MNYLPYILIFILALIFTCLFMAYIRYNNVITKGISKTYEYSKKLEALRLEEEKKAFKIWGIQEEKGLVKKIDSKIRHSGIKEFVPFLNAENCIYISVIGTFLLSFIGFIIFHNFILAIGIGALFPIIIYIVINVMSDITYKKAEKDLLLFIDLVHTYSMSSDDIIEILDTVSFQMAEPLRSNIALCCNQARVTGNISGAINDLVSSIGHPKFFEVFTNLEIGSKYRANYRELIENMKEDIQQYLANREEEKQIKFSAKLTWGILIGFGALAMYMAQGLGEKPIMEVLTENLLGQLLLGYSAIVVVYVIIQMFKSDGK